ncbi:MAG: hypothetical protein V4737_15010, partial [Curtobacterium sp.]
VTVDGTTVKASVNLNLDDTLTQVLAQPLTDGAVTITPSTGAITVDLDELTALNGQPANTPVLTDAAVASINQSIATILGTQLPTALRTAVVNTINSTAVRIDVAANVRSAVGALDRITIRVDSTLGQLAGSAPGTPTTTVTGGPLGLSLLGTLLTPAITSLVVPAAQTLVRPLVTGTALDDLGTALRATTTAVARTLAPVVLLLRQVVDLTVNAQDTSTGFRDGRGDDTGARSVHALRLSVLPGADVATVDLATSTVRAAAFATPTITAPTAGQQFTVPSAASTRSITVSGAGEPGATVRVDLGGGRTGTATVAANGTWTTSVANVPTGEYTATATQTVGGTAAGAVTQRFTVVAQQPLVVTTPTAGRTFTIAGTSTTVTLTGTATPGARVDVDLGGGRTGTATVAADGSWRVPVADLPTGSWTASVTQTVGDSTSAPVARSFRVVQAADLTVTSPSAGQDLPLVGTTRQVVLSGTAQPGATVDVDLGDGLAASTTAAADGSWSATVPDVSAGSYDAAVTQTIGGSTSEPVRRAFTVTAAERLRITAPADGSTIRVADPTSTTPVTVRGTAAPGARVSVSIGGAFAATTTADDDGRWSATFAGVPVGERTATATQTVAGTTSDPVTSDFGVVVGEPLVLTAPADGAVLTVLTVDDTTDVRVTGTTQPGATVDVSLGSGRTASTTADDEGDWTLTVAGVPVGTRTLSATQTIGDTTSPVVTRTLTVRAAAALTVTTPTQDSSTTVATADSTIAVRVSGTAEPDADVDVRLDGGGAVGTPAGDDGTWSVTLPGVDVDVHTVRVTQTVGGATSGPVDRDFEVVAGAPVAIDTPVAGAEIASGPGGSAPVVATGTAEPGATVTVRFDDGDPIEVTAGPDGRWTAPATGSVRLDTDDHTVTAVVTVNGTRGDTVARAFSVVPGTAITIETPPVGTRIVVVDEDARATVPITGTAEPGAAVSVSVDGGTAFTTTADPTSGAWTVTAAGIAPTGTHTVNATQTVGSVSTSAIPTTFQVVTAAPVRITAPTTDP